MTETHETEGALTLQEVFDRVAFHLLVVQPKKSTTRTEDGADRCLYRGPYGLKCAIGALLSDEEYAVIEAAKRNQSSVAALGSTLPRRFWSLASITARGDSRSALSRLQDIHDVNEVEEWGYALRDFAEGFGLQWPEGVPEHVVFDDSELDFPVERPEYFQELPLAAFQA